jgi:DNA-binding transcriptional ArsR family regulator
MSVSASPLSDPTLRSLSKELLVAKVIFDSQEAHRLLSFDELVDRLSELASRPTVSRALDALFDKGVVQAEWKELEGESVRLLEIAGEAKEFVRLVSQNYKAILAETPKRPSAER